VWRLKAWTVTNPLFSIAQVVEKHEPLSVSMTGDTIVVNYAAPTTAIRVAFYAVDIEVIFSSEPFMKVRKGLRLLANCLLFEAEFF
jgi:hypothetical protein